MSPKTSDRPPPAPGLQIDVVRREGVWPHEAVGDGSIARALDAAFLAAGGSGACEVAVTLAGDEEVRSLNREWRGKDAPTNVLSFPLDAPPPPGMARPLGDIVLAWETVQREACGKGIPVADHALHLCVHGLLHILGYDHGDDGEADRMERLETRILAGLGIADPYGLDETEAAGAA
ncbi:MAG: rRNA maturation RNase YbeY [Hyphomicrobiales bacterium]